MAIVFWITWSEYIIVEMYVSTLVAFKEHNSLIDIAIWLNEFWCLMINTTCELMCLLVFMFIVHRMRR
jgi:hypothetical protein